MGFVMRLSLLRQKTARFLLAALVSGANACVPAMADEVGSYTLDGFAVSVDWKDDACLLRLSRGETEASFKLPLPMPCAIHMGGAGTPRTIKRSDGLFFLVESSKPLAAGSADCDTRIQAVRLDAFGADLAPVIERVAACLPMDWDDAVFLSMFPVK